MDTTFVEGGALPEQPRAVPATELEALRHLESPIWNVLHATTMLRNVTDMVLRKALGTTSEEAHFRPLLPTSRDVEALSCASGHLDEMTQKLRTEFVASFVAAGGASG